MTTSPASLAILRKMNSQIDDMCRRLKKIRGEAAGIARDPQMPDASMHLNDVLKTTEDATMAILDAATGIDSAVQATDLAESGKAVIAGYVGTIYESCGFQDISGQRIRKVMDYLSELEEQLLRLSDISRGPSMEEKKDSLLNGPQLTVAAPDQTEIDTLFREAK